ncbi:oxidoreductase [Desulfosarcina widdelii]|uniref:Oxidoreductase n=2 Tax=Desulfosarcina widdelii TaxID=947919 RepID=A0A5K7ZAR7_9BACT|nr:oxidoreductase [Desulfosarcina widdelii]
MIIDIEKCEDCNNCFMACKDEHVDNDFPPYSAAQPLHDHRWMNIMRRERGSGSLMDVAYRPTPCMHCDDAPCIRAAENGAVYKREDGIVIIDPVKSTGQKNIQKACPYNAVYWNEERDIPQKCNFCAHLLDGGWEEPRCVQACPTGALSIVKADDAQIQKMVKEENLEALHPEYNTFPRVFYRNLYRYNRAFIAGSVAYGADSGEECAKNAVVSLVKNGRAVYECKTDFFGDFKFDGLKENGQTYEVHILLATFPEKILTVDLKTSINLGAVTL